MTRLISALILALLLFIGWSLYHRLENVREKKKSDEKESAAHVVTPQQLSGMPPQWEPLLQAAEQQGPVALRKWLKTYGSYVQDPRKAWIELDYCALIARDSPNEAKQIFEGVKQRTPPSSPIWPRIRGLEKTYE